MEISITGSRSIKDEKYIFDYLDRILPKKECLTLVTGGYTYVDKIVVKYAIQKGILYREVKPNWEKHGRKAFYQRNLLLIDCEKAIIFWDGKSPGTSQFIHRCKRYNVDFRLKIIGS